jgi:hypothetical protein
MSSDSIPLCNRPQCDNFAQLRISVAGTDYARQVCPTDTGWAKTELESDFPGRQIVREGLDDDTDGM